MNSSRLATCWPALVTAAAGVVIVTVTIGAVVVAVELLVRDPLEN